jgi:nicotinate (nicotinamide) nucleotide adenylyltransferase
MMDIPLQAKTDMSPANNEPLTIGVFGGSFNPIHLGHALLAITTQQTMPVHAVVLVPVYKHAVKRDLLPFDDRVCMCQLAVQPFSNNNASKSSNNAISVSTVERDVGESNGAMLRGLKKLYPPSTRFLWICGDDFFRWWLRPKGLETLGEVDGLIVQRRLHKSTDANDSFFKEPMNEREIRATASTLNLSIDFIYGELPHFSSTLVRRAPGTWKSFLPQSVVKYLDERPHLLKQLHDNLEADVQKEQSESNIHRSAGEKRTRQEVETLADLSLTDNFAASSIMMGLDLVHALQLERGRAGLFLSIGSEETKSQLKQAQENTDSLVTEFLKLVPDKKNTTSINHDEVKSLAEELEQIPVWLDRDRAVVYRHAQELLALNGKEGWARRYSLVEKFDPRMDVLIGNCVRALQEILQNKDQNISQLLLKWSRGKEALGRLRAFVCAGGPQAPIIIKESYEMRELLQSKIQDKETNIHRVLSLTTNANELRLAAPDALLKLLEQVTSWEWSLMGCFAPSTPLLLQHKLLQTNDAIDQNSDQFKVEAFFEASSAALDLMLTFVKALAASGCARAYSE